MMLTKGEKIPNSLINKRARDTNAVEAMGCAIGRIERRPPGRVSTTNKRPSCSTIRNWPNCLTMSPSSTPKVCTLVMAGVGGAFAMALALLAVGLVLGRVRKGHRKDIAA